MNQTHDVFPAYVIFVPAHVATSIDEMRSFPPTPKDARFFDRARVVVIGNIVTVAIDGDRGPNVVFREEVARFYKNPDKKLDSKIVTVSGKKLVYKRNDACGCGSRLRAWNPYKTLNSSQDPTK